MIDPRLPTYLVIVASLVFRGLAYIAGIKTPLIIKTFVSDQLQLAVTMGELYGNEVDDYLHHHGTPGTRPMVDMMLYHSARAVNQKANNANPRQEKNHTMATKMEWPKTINEYLSAHALLDWFVEVDAYLEFLDMTALDQVDVVTS